MKMEAVVSYPPDHTASHYRKSCSLHAHSCENHPMLKQDVKLTVFHIDTGAVNQQTVPHPAVKEY